VIQPVTFDPFAGGCVHFSSFGCAMIVNNDQKYLPQMAAQAVPITNSPSQIRF
jgi:hypothetical protein